MIINTYNWAKSKNGIFAFSLLPGIILDVLRSKADTRYSLSLLFWVWEIEMIITLKNGQDENSN
jgi:hypothetical protein